MEKTGCLSAVAGRVNAIISPREITVPFSTMHIWRENCLELIGLSPERLRLEWVSASEGSRYAEAMNDFSKKVKDLGPLGKGEGIDETVLKRKLEVVYHLVPYIKLVERERLAYSR